jgi:hypothetical protein
MTMEGERIEAEGNKGEGVAEGLVNRKLADILDGPPAKSFFVDTRHQSHYVTYMCGNERCKHTEEIGFFDGEVVPPCWNCPVCHGGQGIPVDQMIAERKGMFVVPKTASEVDANRARNKMIQQAVDRVRGKQ